MGILQNLWKEDKKKIVLYGIGILCFILLFSVLLFFIIRLTKRYSYTELEEKLVESTSKYVQKNPSFLPTLTNPVVRIDHSTLTNEKFLKDFSKISKDKTCTGVVTIYYNEGNYRFTPILSCDNYESFTLYDQILNKSPIFSLNEQEDGLYLLNDFYTYRGEYVTNYLSFAGFLWRIIKFNEDSFLIVLADTVNKRSTTYVYDDRYNETINSNRGRNSFESSRIKESLTQIYERDFASYHPYIIPTEACAGNRNKNENDTSGSIECFEMVQTPMSLMSVYDFMNASLDSKCETSISKNCSNYNYLSVTTSRYWFINGTDEDTYHVYYSDPTGKLSLDYASAKKDIRPVLSLPTDLLFSSGDGTLENPYTIKTF